MTPGDLAAALGLSDDEVGRLLARHARTIRKARTVRRVGDYLVTGYPRAAATAFFQLGAVLLAFLVGTAWQAREAELRDLRSQLAVLRPMGDEITILAADARALLRTPPRPCVIPPFKTPLWRSISITERALLLGDELYKLVRATYDEVAVAPETARIMDEAGCVEFLTDLKTKLETLEQVTRTHIRTVEARYHGRNRPLVVQIASFLGVVMAVSVVLLALPPALYLVLARVLR